MKRTLIVVAAAVLSLGLAVPAGAELNLWLTYHFAGVDAYRAGYYGDAEQLLQNALNVIDDSKDNAHRRAETLEYLGMAARAKTAYPEAEQYFKQALELEKAKLGKESRPVPGTMTQLADLYYLTGQTEESERLYDEALELLRDDQRNLEVCRALNGLALIHNDRGEFVPAESCLERAITLHKKAGRKLCAYLATCYINLGSLYVNIDRLDAASEALDAATYIQEKQLRADHPDHAVRLYALAQLARKQGKAGEAEKLESRVSAIQEKNGLAAIGG